MSRSFQYQARAADAWQERSEQRGGGFVSYIKPSIQQFSVQKKENFIRILPPTWPSPKHYGYDVWVHYGVGPQQATVLCNLKMFNTKCPVCDAYAIADGQGKEDAYDLKANRRVLVWLINRKDANLPPLAWGMPWTLDRDISKLCKDPQTGELYQIDHPDNGYDLSFERDGEGQNVKYVGVQIARRPSSVEDKYLDYIVANPLPDILVKRSYEEVCALFEGGASQPQPPPPPPQPEQQSAQAPWTQPQQQTPVQQAPAQQPAPIAQPEPRWTPPVQQPIQPNTYCPASVSFGGQTLACGLIAGHDPNAQPHDFNRPLAQAPVVNQPEPQPVQQSFPQQTTPVAQAPVQTTAAPATGGRAAALRERFTKQ